MSDNFQHLFITTQPAKSSNTAFVLQCSMVVSRSALLLYMAWLMGGSRKCSLVCSYTKIMVTLSCRRDNWALDCCCWMACSCLIICHLGLQIYAPNQLQKLSCYVFKQLEVRAWMNNHITNIKGKQSLIYAIITTIKPYCQEWPQRVPFRIMLTFISPPVKSVERNM